MSVSGFRTWQIATATNMHFKSASFDAFKFHFKSKNLSMSAFEKRKDKYFFEKLAHKLQKEEVVKQYVFANVFFDDKSWIGHMVEEPYKEYTKRLQSFSYLFTQELKTIDFNNALNSQNGEIPDIIKKYLYGSIMAESVIAINMVTDFIRIADGKVTDTLLWPDVKMKLEKATPFIREMIDATKIKTIIVKQLV